MLKWWNDPTRTVRLASILVAGIALVGVLLLESPVDATVAGVALAVIAVMWALEQTAPSHRFSEEARGREERMIELLASIDSRLARIEMQREAAEDEAADV
jgi:hypothetical protein